MLQKKVLYLLVYPVYLIAACEAPCTSGFERDLLLVYCSSEHLNHFHEDLKFTINHDGLQITFLGILAKREGALLGTDLFREETW